ncbi:MAG: hypothetical protein E7492_07295 [Ruminococcaceae bacterium]|nr:hypothetical protein [Oscillospiraceae bacterium]
MERIKNMDKYYKVLAALSLVMVIVFAFAYHITVAKVGYAFNDAILVPVKENNTTVYTGEAFGHSLDVTVTDDKTVTFDYSHKSYGPYTVIYDETAVANIEDNSRKLTGVEIRNGEEIFFRGGFFESFGGEKSIWLYNENGDIDGFDIYYVDSDGVERDADGNLVDRLVPSAGTILELTHQPTLTHKGDWQAWFYGTALLLLNIVLMMFEKELFHWGLSFEIRNADKAQMSGWGKTSRRISSTILVVVVLLLYTVGLGNYW